MTEPEVFVLADETLKGVVDQIKDDQWEMEIPDWFKSSAGKMGNTLRDIINYHAYDDIWVPDMLAGKTMEEVGKDKWKDEDLLGDNPKASFAAIVGKAMAAAKGFNKLDMTVHCSFGDFPASGYFQQINMFRAIRAYEIAKLIGADTKLPDSLVQGIWDEISPHAEEWRKIGVFGPEISVAADASLQDKLLGLTGRQP